MEKTYKNIEAYPVFTSCKCGKWVQFSQNPMGWLVSDCECGYHLRMNIDRTKMIGEQRNERVKFSAA